MAYDVKLGDNVYEGVEAVQLNTTDGGVALFTSETPTSTIPNWNASQTEEGYIENRPFYKISGVVEWDGVTSSYNYLFEGLNETAYYIANTADLKVRPEDLVGQDIVLSQLSSVTETTYTISTGTHRIWDYCKTSFEVDEYKTMTSPYLIVVKGHIFNIPTASWVLLFVWKTTNTETGEEIINELPMLMYCNAIDILAEGSPIGWYGFKRDGKYCSKINYNSTKIDANYSKFFNTLETPIHVVSMESLTDLDYKIFQIGDIILGLTANAE